MAFADSILASQMVHMMNWTGRTMGGRTTALAQIAHVGFITPFVRPFSICFNFSRSAWLRLFCSQTTQSPDDCVGSTVHSHPGVGQVGSVVPNLFISTPLSRAEPFICLPGSGSGVDAMLVRLLGVESASSAGRGCHALIVVFVYGVKNVGEGRRPRVLSLAAGRLATRTSRSDRRKM